MNPEVQLSDTSGFVFWVCRKFVFRMTLRRLARFRGCLLWSLYFACGPWANAASFAWLSPELRRIEVERHSLERSLDQLPAEPAPHLTERLGFHSGYLASQTLEWVELDLGRNESLDAVVLIAAASNGSGGLAPGYGFPSRFRVEISDRWDKSDRVVIADYTNADFPNPGLLPIYIPTGGRQARFVRMTATRLFRDGERTLFALGELMLLQGKRNLAGHLSRNDFTYSRTLGALPVWGVSNLVDGHSVLGPPEGSTPSPALGYCSQAVNITLDPRPAPRWIQVDLGERVPVQEVRVFPAHPPEFEHRPGYGFPLGLKVEVSDNADFCDPIQVSGFRDGSGLVQRDPVSPGDNPISFYARDEMVQFVRVIAPRLFDSNGQYLFALGELQVWSGDKNVALGKMVSAFDSNETKGWSMAALVDGFTSRANILDWPEWLAGLSQRRDANQQLAALAAREVAIEMRLKRIVWWLAGAVLATLPLVALGIHLGQRRERRLEMEALRQRISQDLHDEIGSGLGSIAFISEDALALADNEPMRHELNEIRDTARQTLDSMRDLVRLAQAGKYGHGDLTAHFHEIASRALRGIAYTFQDAAAAAFNRLSMHKRRDLVLMFKEVLHNLAWHAQATQAEIRLVQGVGTLTLMVRDNGCGFDPKSVASDGMGLSNLQRRANKHGGNVQIVSAPGSGTTLTITIPEL